MIDQAAFTMLFFESHPDEEFDSYDAEEKLRHGWLDITSEKFRDPGRKMRELREEGYLTSRTVGNVLLLKFRQPYNA